ncbi:MAG: DNA polymerase ligase N-terminal domain-containing protein, partial [Candidatus Thermoplasmatota archaeon]
YKGKREFGKTPEPEGKEKTGRNKHRFVIQLHHAKKAGDHYDLRLENDDSALSSWSIPKHRLPKGKEKLLAVKTEDHPVEYLKFKGEIPAGEYGAGTMEIHDSGTYEEIETGKSKIVFRLKGKKEKGTYKLFRAGDGKKWLIMADGKEAVALPPLSKTAAHSGAMLALMAPPAIARKMRKAKMVEDEDLSDTLHMTLLYLGKAADLGKETLEAVRKAAERVCARHEPLEMGISGAGMFTPEKDGTPVYVVPNAKGLSALQADLENAIGSIVDLPSEHGWVPHMTVSYCQDGEPELPDLSERLEWTADKVRLQAGDEKIADIPIGRRKRGGDDPPLSRRADRVSRKVKPLLREPAPDERMWKGIWETYEDPVRHMREDRPHVVLPQNIPDWAVAAEGLERPQDLPSNEGLEPSDPDGQYHVVDMDDNIVAKYDTKEKAIRNAEASRWSSRVFHSTHADPWDAFVYMEKGDKPVVWERTPEQSRRMMAEIRAKRGPYYLIDYWGRALASYDDLDRAVRNAEGSMYVSQIVFSMVDDPDRGKVVWTKPEPATIRSSKAFPLSKRAALERLPIAADPAMWTDELVEDAAKRLTKRLEAERAGFDPERMADDDALELALIGSEG